MRFTLENPNDWGYTIKDNKTKKEYSCDSNQRMKDICTLLNTFEEKQEKYNEYTTELETLIENNNKKQAETKNTIQTMMENERTHIGHNVLKQLYNALYGI